MVEVLATIWIFLSFILSLNRLVRVLSRSTVFQPRSIYPLSWYPFYFYKINSFTRRFLTRLIPSKVAQLLSVSSREKLSPLRDLRFLSLWFLLRCFFFTLIPFVLVAWTKPSLSIQPISARCFFSAMHLWDLRTGKPRRFLESWFYTRDYERARLHSWIVWDIVRTISRCDWHLPLVNVTVSNVYRRSRRLKVKIKAIWEILQGSKSNNVDVTAILYLCFIDQQRYISITLCKFVHLLKKKSCKYPAILL